MFDDCHLFSMLLHGVCWNVTHMYLIALSVHMLVRSRFMLSSHFNHIAANVAMSTAWLHTQ